MQVDSYAAGHLRLSRPKRVFPLHALFPKIIQIAVGPYMGRVESGVLEGSAKHVCVEATAYIEADSAEEMLLSLDAIMSPLAEARICLVPDPISSLNCVDSSNVL